MAETIPKNLAPAEKIKLLKQIEEEKKKKAKELEEEVEELEVQIEKDEEVAEIEERQVHALMDRELEKLKLRLKGQEKEEEEEKPKKEPEKKNLEEEISSSPINEEAKKAMNLDYKINIGQVANKDVYDRLAEIRNKAVSHEYINKDEREFLDSVRDPIQDVYKNMSKYETPDESFKRISKEKYMLDQIAKYEK